MTPEQRATVAHIGLSNRIADAVAELLITRTLMHGDGQIIVGAATRPTYGELKLHAHFNQFNQPPIHVAMKKRTLLASTVALIAGGMIGAVSPIPPQAEQLTKNQIQQEQQRGSQSSDQQQEATKTARQQPDANELKDFADQLSYALPSHNPQQSRRFYRNVSNGHGGGFNKITHSRRTKRKHRRA
ncbi:hypothetical protein [Spirosoma sp.]|uniref:hypothetical protein n=1 Tax=Spirosoma sp. TaxID=1899569 RepID=UPI002626A994|nr:hypothetical protein [Spirosoma sp.]MCX6217638.1 hypothetical protein [Spirosoma sp.]